jgi:hypothetical protein
MTALYDGVGKEVLAELSDRRGVRQTLDDMTDEDKAELVAALARRAVHGTIARLWEPSDAMIDAGIKRMPYGYWPAPVWDTMIGAFCEEEGVDWRPADGS